MKIFSKIGLTLIVLGWVCFAWFLFMDLGSELAWVEACGAGITNVWNAVFGTSHTAPGFFNRLEDVLYGFFLVFTPISLFFIILFVKVNREEDEKELEEELEVRKAKKAEEKEMKAKLKEGKKLEVKKARDAKRAAKLSEKKAKIDEAAEVAKNITDAGAAVSGAVDSFLSFLNSKK